jgi:uroporphyrinogen decarboxylase
MYDRLGIDGIIGVAPPYIGPPLPALGDGGWYGLQAWGMRFARQEYADGAYWEQCYYPLAEAETIEDLEAYSWPDPDWYDYEALPVLCAQHPDRAVEVGYTAVFYYHNMLRGLERSLMDPLLRPEFTHYLIQRISDTFTEYHRRCFEAARGLIDLTQVTDDLGSQRGLLIGPQVFQEFYRAPMQRAIDLARSHGIAVFHHDDGDMRRMLPALIEMGIDVLNPIQWRCGDWDLAALKAQFGQRLCFHGGVDNQQTLPHGTPDDVRSEVRRLIDTLASDRTGLIIAPCHNIQPNTPVQNIVALYEAAREYGVYDHR